MVFITQNPHRILETDFYQELYHSWPISVPYLLLSWSLLPNVHDSSKMSVCLFDTIDHSILLQRLTKRIGLRGTPLWWVESYLKDRTQFVSIGGERSTPKVLAYGVPQGSVLGLIFFTIYTLPIGDIFCKYNMSFHLYADDTQLYMTFDNNIPVSKATARSQMECYIEEIWS